MLVIHRHPIQWEIAIVAFIVQESNIHRMVSIRETLNLKERVIEYRRVSVRNHRHNGGIATIDGRARIRPAVRDERNVHRNSHSWKQIRSTCFQSGEETSAHQ